MSTPLLTVRPIPLDWRPELSVYASAPFLKSVSTEHGWLGGFDGANRLRCVLPFTVLRKAVFSFVRFRVETIPWDGALAPEEERAFLNAVVAYFRGRKADLILPATTNTIFRVVPDGAVAAPYGTYLVNLQQPEEKLLANMHAKHRNVVRNAEKKGVKVRIGHEHLPVAHDLITRTLQRSKLGFMSLPALERQVAALGDQARVLLAEHEGVPQGCAIYPWSLHTAYYLYAGSAERTLTGAMNYLNWEAMRYFRSLGVARYDFVGARVNPEKGSKQEGLTMFKERFGGGMSVGFMWKYPLSRWKFMAYNLAMRLTRGGDIVDQERRRLSAPAAAVPPAGEISVEE